MKALTTTEINNVLNAAKGSPRDQAMICTAFKHGMRASEVCGLLTSDLDIANKSIKVRRLKHSLTTVQPIDNLFNELELIKGWLQTKSHETEHVFTNSQGHKITRVQFFRIFRKWAERAGIPTDRRHPHVLKHSLGYALVANNVHLVHIKAALGHRSIASTIHYTDPTPEQTANEVNRALSAASGTILRDV